MDLGKHPRLQGQRAVSTVAGIIDGTGAVGAALGQYLVGMLSETWTDPRYILWKFGAVWLILK